MFFKIGALKNFVIFKEKQLCWTLFLMYLNKLFYFMINRKMKLLKSKIKFEKKQKKSRKNENKTKECQINLKTVTIFITYRKIKDIFNG